MGPLQSNKVKMALEIFDVIQTIDREKIVLKIKDLLNSEFQTRSYRFFIQVNIGDEKQKKAVLRFPNFRLFLNGLIKTKS